MHATSILDHVLTGSNSAAVYSERKLLCYEVADKGCDDRELCIVVLPAGCQYLPVSVLI